MTAKHNLLVFINAKVLEPRDALQIITRGRIVAVARTAHPRLHPVLQACLVQQSLFYRVNATI